MQKTLIDSGSLIALFDRSDKYHHKVLDFLKSYRGELITTWPVLTEVSHILDFNLQVQIDFLQWIERGGVLVYEINQSEIMQIRVMMQKYLDVPMDLADASLVYIAKKEQIDDIISIDSDFDIYQVTKKKFLNNLLR